MPRIHFLDVTNRDGVQTARTGLSKFGKTMVNFYLGRLGVAQSEIGFPFLFHEVPYVRAQVALGEAGAFGDLRLSGWCRAVAGRRGEGRCRSGCAHYNLSISTSRPDAPEQVPRPARPRRDHPGDDGRRCAPRRTAARETVGVNAEDGSRTDDAFLTEFALAAKEAGADRVRYCDTIGGDTPGPDRRAVRQARQRHRHAGRDALPQRPRHGRGQLGRRRARRPRRRPGRLDQHVRQRHRRAVRQRRPALVRSWRCATGSASPTGSRSATRST